MRGHEKNLVSEAKMAFSDLKSAFDHLANLVSREAPSLDLNIDHRRAGLAVKQGMSALDKLQHLLEASKINDPDVREVEDPPEGEGPPGQ